MRICQSILAIILVITSISCQSVPQSPVPRTAESEAIHQGCAPAPGGETGTAADKYLEEPREEPEITRSVSIGGETKPPPKKSPIKPVIAPVKTGLLGPSTQEIPEGAALPAQKEKQRIVLNFEKADIAEVSSQIFSDQLKLNYVMDQTLQGRISMYIDGDFNNQELLQMVIRAYEANGISVIPKKGFYFIQLSQKTGGGLPTANEQLLGEKGTRPLIVIYRLRFMDPKQASNLLTPFLTPGRKITTDPVINSVIFTEDTDNARVLINLLKTVDINVLQEVSMEIVPLSSIAPQDAIQGMEALMGKLGGFKESTIKNNLAFLPLNNFGGVLVMAQNPELLISARQWLQALDVRGVGKQQEIYVYFVQNGLATDIAQIVASVLGISTGGGMGQKIVPSGTKGGSTFGGTGGFGAGGTSGGGTSGFGGGGTSGFGGGGMGGLGGGGGGGLGGGGMGGGTSGGSAFGGAGSTTGGVSGSTYGTAASRGATAGGGSAYGTTGTTAGAAAPGTPGSIFTGEVMVIPDEVNNAIVIRANAVDYAKIKKTIETLDILPRAVLVELMIVEVDLTKDFEFGLQYWFQQHPQSQTGYGISFGGLSNNTTVSSASTVSNFPPNLGALSAASGLTQAGSIAMSWVANSQNAAVLLQALSSKTHTTVLSTPTLLATDNKTASIMVGGMQPIPTGTVSGTTVGADLYSTIDYEPTGVLLNIIPHINAGGLVRLEVQQIVRDVSANATVGAANTAPTFTERDINTTIFAQNGKTVVIGGIILANNQLAKTGIPYLENIPLLSPLFASKSTSLQRTELLVAITPHVIDQRGSQAPAELLQKLQNLRRRVGE
ncbi:General secretion pathway protein D [Syntrophobacter sp. SbD1]|nr:General secretion pathway protein D [Syntrophobacter sp. SbD1]